jgi:hypothetical protein
MTHLQNLAGETSSAILRGLVPGSIEAGWSVALNDDNANGNLTEKEAVVV